MFAAMTQPIAASMLASRRSQSTWPPTSLKRLGSLGARGGLNKQVSEPDLEHPGQLFQDDDADVHCATFNLTQVRRSNFRLSRKRFDRQAALYAQPTDVPADKLLCLHRREATSLPTLNTVDISTIYLNRLSGGALAAWVWVTAAIRSGRLNFSTHWGCAMRHVAIGALLSTTVCFGASAQTAEFKCPKPGTVVEMSDGARTTWQGAEPTYCKTLAKPASGDEFAAVWYAPTVGLRANQSQAFADQIKPWMLWPLSVGKKITGRFDGVGSNPSFGTGSWVNTITVDGYEKVTTKAGTFDVFLITRAEEALSHRYRSTARSWYAPALGVVVKLTFTDNQGASRAAEAVAIRQ